LYTRNRNRKEASASEQSSSPREPSCCGLDRQAPGRRVKGPRPFP
jgi:hypothetical protein